MTNHETTPYPQVLVTGTQGRVGKAIMPNLLHAFKIAELDIAPPVTDKEVYTQGDITELEVVMGAVEKVRPDCIVHLAANADPNAPEYQIARPNYIGLHNIYKAAVQHGVSKIVLASSLYTLSGYPGFPDKSPFEDGRKFSPSDPPKPGNPYGASKVYAERLAQKYYDNHGLRSTILRLGDLNPSNEPAAEPHAQFAPIWLSHPDATQAFARAILVDTKEPVATYFVTSDNDGPYDIRPTIDDLGYHPVDGIAKR